MSSTSIPPFPSGLPETSLVSISLEKLQTADSTTLSSLFSTAQSHGFIYLDLRPQSNTSPSSSTQASLLLSSSSALQQLASRAITLPRESKAAIHQSVTKSIFGWKSSGAIAAADPFARGDVSEFFNISKDDILQNKGRVDVQYPSPLIDDRELLESFIKNAHQVGLLILRQLGSKLNIPAEEIENRHRISQKSGDHIRLTWGPGDASAKDMNDEEENQAISRLSNADEKDIDITVYGHTDFGTITLLFNWLGGLQIENRKTGKWEWVRPLPGHAIVNLGDAGVVFSGGRLASGKHRVLAAPGKQSALDRYSVVYFVRPEDSVVMESLVPEDKEDGKNGVNGKYHEQRTGVMAGDHENKMVANLKSGQDITAGEWIRARTLAMGNPVLGKSA